MHYRAMNAFRPVIQYGGPLTASKCQVSVFTSLTHGTMRRVYQQELGDRNKLIDERIRNITSIHVKTTRSGDKRPVMAEYNYSASFAGGDFNS